MSHDDSSPRFFSASLDTQETSPDGWRIDHEIASNREVARAKSWDAKCRQKGRIMTAQPLETSFRHSGWARTRNLVGDAMILNEEEPGRIQRFAACGAGCQVHVRKDGQAAKLSASYCHDRFCLPCMKARAREILDHLLAWCDGVDPLMITLTLRRRDEPLGCTLDHLLASFARLRAQEGWLAKIDAGAYCVEITRGKHGTHWHVHLHAICIGGYYPQNELSNAWAVASRGSTIVHVTRASTAKRGISYAAEYASKGWSYECLSSPGLVCELLDGLRSRRLLGTFGGWRGRRVEADQQPAEGYRRVGSLMEIVRDAARGQQYAIGLCRLLGVAVVSGEGQISFVRSKRFPQPREECDGASPRGSIPPGHSP